MTATNTYLKSNEFVFYECLSTPDAQSSEGTRNKDNSKEDTFIRHND